MPLRSNARHDGLIARPKELSSPASPCPSRDGRRWRRAARLVTADGAAQDSIPDDAVLSVDGPREWPVRFPSDVHVSSFESVYSLMFTPSKTYGINRVRRESFLGR